ncbi:MAG TPA: flavoprotein, partial [Chthoniobacterales bacterium]|nr:flavoprotein [Chthoniobacterales bacterium]
MRKNSNRRPEKTGARKVVRLRGAGKTIVLGVTGSIAACKSAELASLLVKQGHQVFAVMTHDATEFITPLTLQTLSKKPVMTSFFDEKENWRPGHIELADRANLLLIAPATANTIAELAHGLANHPLAAIALATRAPILIA